VVYLAEEDQIQHQPGKETEAQELHDKVLVVFFVEKQRDERKSLRPEHRETDGEKKKKKKG